MALTPVHRITIYVPASHAQAFRQAVLAADDLSIGGYSETLWTMPATEQFRPGPGSHPTVGTPGELSEVPAVRMELSIPRQPARLERLLAAIHAAHPWEVPAVFVEDVWFALP